MTNADARDIVEDAFKEQVKKLFEVMITNIETGVKPEEAQGMFGRGFALSKDARERALAVADRLFP